MLIRDKRHRQDNTKERWGMLMKNNRYLEALVIGAVMSGVMGVSTPTGLAAPELPDVDRPTAGSSYTELRDKEEIRPSSREVDIELPEEERPEFNASDALKVQANGFTVTGQDIFREDELLKLLEDKKGKLLTFKELQEGADRLTKHFRDKGYLTARVYLPVQKITGGIVEYTVTVGRLGEIKIVNNTSIHDNVLKRESRALKRGDYIRKEKLERAVWLMSDLAGADAKATLSKGSEDGTVDVVVELNPHMGKQGSLTFDNYGNRYTGYKEAIFSYNLLNPFHEGDQLAITASTTGKGLFNGGANYSVPALTDGLRVSGGYNVLRYELGKEYDSLGAYGTAHVVNFGFDYAVRRSQRNNLYIGLHYEGNELDDVEKNSLLGHYADKHSDAAVLSIYGDEQDKYGVTSWRTEYKHGWLGFNNDMTRQIYERSGAFGTFKKLKLNIIRRQNLNNRLYALLSLRGQYAFDNLDSSEHISLGGIAGVRAYPQSEASGDMGYLTRAELRWMIPTGKQSQSFQTAVYFDHGGIWYERKNSHGENRRSLQGAGIGVIWSQRDEWFLRMDYAWRIGAEKATSDTHYGRGHFWIQGGIFF